MIPYEPIWAMSNTNVYQYHSQVGFDTDDVKIRYIMLYDGLFSSDLHIFDLRYHNG